MKVYRVLACARCSYRRWDGEPVKVLPPCPRCGAPTHYAPGWYYRYQYKGVRRKRYGGPTKRMAEAALGKVQADIQERRLFPDKIVETPWKVAVERFLEFVKSNNSPGTFNVYSNNLRTMTPHFRQYTLNEVTPLIAERYKISRRGMVTKQGRPISDSTLKSEIVTLKYLFNWSAKMGLLANNQLLGRIENPKDGPGREIFLTDAQVAKLLECCDAPDVRMAVLIALNTGLRASDVCSLKWSEIRDAIITKVAKKTGKPVHIPLTATLERELTRYRQEQRVFGVYILPARLDAHIPLPYGTLQDAFKETSIAAGLGKNFHFHDLRHTFASNYIMAGNSQKSLKEILGHSNIHQTDKYTHLTPGYQREAMERFEKRSRPKGEESVAEDGEGERQPGQDHQVGEGPLTGRGVKS